MRFERLSPPTTTTSPRAVIKVISREEEECDADGGEHDEVAGDYERTGAPRDRLRVREDDRKSECGNNENARDEDARLRAGVTSSGKGFTEVKWKTYALIWAQPFIISVNVAPSTNRPMCGHTEDCLTLSTPK